MRRKRERRRKREGKRGLVIYVNHPTKMVTLHYSSCFQTHKKKNTENGYWGAVESIEEAEKIASDYFYKFRECGWCYPVSRPKRSREEVETGRKLKSWIKRIFPSMKLNEIICGNCYNEVPSWIWRKGVLVCSYCGASKDNSLKTHEISEDKLFELMRERVWGSSRL